MKVDRLAAAVAIACVACAEERAPPVPYEHGSPKDGGPRDAAGDRCGGGDADAAACPPDAARPAAVPAVFEPDDLGAPQCARFDESVPREPQLFALDDHLYVVDTDPTADVPPLRIRTAATGLDFGAPVTLLYGARRADVIAEGGKLLLLAARQFYAVALESPDGNAWTELQNVAPDEPTYSCEGYPPLAFFRGRTPVRFLAMGDDFNDGIFGCSDRAFLSRRKAGAWETPTQIGQGDVLFALDGERRLVISTTFGTLASDDEGMTFVRQPEVGGSGAAWTGTRLVVADVYDGPGTGGVVVVFSDDEAQSWKAPVVLLAEPVYAAPLVAADGETLAVAVALSDALAVTRSTNGGDTWTEPRRLARGDGTRLDAVAVDGRRVAWLTTGDRYEVCAIE